MVGDFGVGGVVGREGFVREARWCEKESGKRGAMIDRFGSVDGCFVESNG